MKIQLAAAVAAASLCGVEAGSPFYTNPKPYSQDFLDNYNVLKYTSWMGPWSQRRGVGLNRDPPPGCKVDQVALLHRHGARYPDKGAATSIAQVYAKVENLQGKLEGSLEFANWWVPYTTPDDGLIAQESTIGPYAGLVDAYTRGAEYRRRYGHLWDSESVIPIFTSGYERIVMTGRRFGEGFLGFNYTDLAAVNIIPEIADQGANTLVPVCNLDTATTCDVPNDSDKKTWPANAPWVYEEFTAAAKRLNKENKALNLTAADIPNLMSIAPYELNIRGSSPWITVFTSEEWIAFEYLQSAYYYCYAGPGATNVKELGSLYLNATRTLLKQGPNDSLPLIFSFTHDTDITPVVSLLGFASDASFNASQVEFNKLWDVTDIVPQGGHLVFERLVCTDDTSDENEFANEYPLGFYNTTVVANSTSQNATSSNSTTNSTGGANSTTDKTKKHHNKKTVVVHDRKSKKGKAKGKATTSSTTSSTKEKIYVRVVLNEAVAPLPGCSSGPGKSCALEDFSDFVDKAIKGVDFAKSCKIPKGAPTDLTFYWKWNQTNAYNYDQDPIPYQAGLVDAEDQPINQKNDWRRRRR